MLYLLSGAACQLKLKSISQKPSGLPSLVVSPRSRTAILEKVPIHRERAVQSDQKEPSHTGLIEDLRYDRLPLDPALGLWVFSLKTPMPIK